MNDVQKILRKKQDVEVSIKSLEKARERIEKKLGSKYNLKEISKEIDKKQLELDTYDKQLDVMYKALEGSDEV